MNRLPSAYRLALRLRAARAQAAARDVLIIALAEHGIRQIEDYLKEVAGR